MLNLIALFAVLLFSTLDAGVEDYLKKITPKKKSHSFKNIDFIYMINLDERPEKWQHSIEQLATYGITPYRFSAVNGWTLPLSVINALGTPYEPRMGNGQRGTTYPLELNGLPCYEAMEVPGKAYYVHQMSRGAIGIVLSHLSILKDAYDSGYETIWILEDDIEVLQDPRSIPQFIKELDKTIGKKGWDILFTDQDTKGSDGNYIPCSSHAWRPDLPAIDLERFKMREDVGVHFKKVGARYGAYSMIVRRSGMKKLLDFFKERSLFLPIDLEYILPPEIHLFSLKQDVVSTLPKALSDNSSPTYLEKNNSSYGTDKF